MGVEAFAASSLLVVDKRILEFIYPTNFRAVRQAISYSEKNIFLFFEINLVSNKKAFTFALPKQNG